MNKNRNKKVSTNILSENGKETDEPVENGKETDESVENRKETDEPVENGKKTDESVENGKETDESVENGKETAESVENEKEETSEAVEIVKEETAESVENGKEESSESVVSARKDYLSEMNRHERDEMIEFIEEGHKYIIKNDDYKSVTTIIHENFTGFDADKIISTMMTGKNWKKGNKYWGMSECDIKESWKKNGDEQSKLGTNLHYEIECFMNIEMKEGGDLSGAEGDSINGSTGSNTVSYTHQDLLSIYEYEIKNNIITADDKGDEWNYFLKYLKDTYWYKPYRTEWKIYHEELKIAGSIDMVYENSDGTLSIYDWKRAKEIQKYNIYKKYSVGECLKNVPDTNFYHYSLQLNLYKYILESKYNKKIKDLYLVRLHPNNKNKTYDLIECKDMTNEIISLVKHRLKYIAS